MSCKYSVHILSKCVGCRWRQITYMRTRNEPKCQCHTKYNAFMLEHQLKERNNCFQMGIITPLINNCMRYNILMRCSFIICSLQYSRLWANRILYFCNIFPPNRKANFGSTTKGDTMRRRRGGGKSLYMNMGQYQGFAQKRQRGMNGL